MNLSRGQSNKAEKQKPLKGSITLFAFFWKSQNVSYYQLNAKNNGDSLLLFNTKFKHWNCFLSSVATESKDGLRLKLEKLTPYHLVHNFTVRALIFVCGG